MTTLYCRCADSCCMLDDIFADKNDFFFITKFFTLDKTFFSKKNNKTETLHRNFQPNSTGINNTNWNNENPKKKKKIPNRPD